MARKKETSVLQPLEIKCCQQLDQAWKKPQSLDKSSLPDTLGPACGGPGQKPQPCPILDSDLQEWQAINGCTSLLGVALLDIGGCVAASLYLIHAGRIPFAVVTTKYVCRHCPKCPGGQNCGHLRTTQL